METDCNLFRTEFKLKKNLIIFSILIQVEKFLSKMKKKKNEIYLAFHSLSIAYL